MIKKTIEEKKAIVLEAITDTVTARKAIAEKHSIHPDTLRKWVRSLEDEVKASLTVAKTTGKVYPEFRIQTVAEDGTVKMVSCWRKLLLSDTEAHVWKFRKTVEKFVEKVRAQYPELTVSIV